jgi:hypothetical protein
MNDDVVLRKATITLKDNSDIGEVVQASYVKFS